MPAPQEQAYLGGCCSVAAWRVSSITFQGHPRFFFVIIKLGLRKLWSCHIHLLQKFQGLFFLRRGAKLFGSSKRSCFFFFFFFFFFRRSERSSGASCSPWPLPFWRWWHCWAFGGRVRRESGAGVVFLFVWLKIEQQSIWGWVKIKPPEYEPPEYVLSSTVLDCIFRLEHFLIPRIFPSNLQKLNFARGCTAPKWYLVWLNIEQQSVYSQSHSFCVQGMTFAYTRQITIRNLGVFAK